MTEMTLLLPDALHEGLARLAEREGISLAELIRLTMSDRAALPFRGREGERAGLRFQIRAARAAAKAEAGEDPMEGLPTG